MFDSHTITLLIKEHGQTATLKKRTMSSYDAATGTLTEASTTYQVKVYGYSVKTELSAFSVEDGSQIFAVSQKLTNGNTTPDFDTDDQIIVGTKTYDVVKVQKVNSGSNALVYMAQVKD